MLCNLFNKMYQFSRCSNLIIARAGLLEKQIDGFK